MPEFFWRSIVSAYTTLMRDRRDDDYVFPKKGHFISVGIQ